jgi:hypothetical protein
MSAAAQGWMFLRGWMDCQIDFGHGPEFSGQGWRYPISSCCTTGASSNCRHDPGTCQRQESKRQQWIFLKTAIFCSN